MEREQQRTREEERVKEPPKKKTRINARGKKKVPTEKTITIRLYPDNKQKEILMKWLRTATWIYNKCLDAVNKDEVRREKRDLRDAWLNSGALSKKSLLWVLETHYGTHNQDITNLLNALESFFAKGDQFQMKYRSRKDKKQGIVIKSKYWGRNREVFAFLTKIKVSCPQPTKLGYGSRIKRTKLGHFYLCILKPLEIRLDNQKPVFTN